jgi:hypothetical protein
LQEAREGLSGEKARLGDLRRLLRAKQRCMVNQVAALYPVRVFREPPAAENHRTDANGEDSVISTDDVAWFWLCFHMIFALFFARELTDRMA